MQEMLQQTRERYSPNINGEGERKNSETCLTLTSGIFIKKLLLHYVTFMFLPGFKPPYTIIYLRVGCNSHTVFYKDTPLIGKYEHFSCKAVVFNTVLMMC